jgi:hypothetical protein
MGSAYEIQLNIFFGKNTRMSPEEVEPRNNNQTCAIHCLASIDDECREFGLNLKSNQR